VFSAQSSSNLAAATEPLFSNFGDGQTVIVAQQADGAATASFIDAPSTDYVSGQAASAIYRRTAERRYHFTEDSCRAMVSDMIAFFSGDREPIFTFTGTRSLDA
jgi:hypothetical protein